MIAHKVLISAAMVTLVTVGVVAGAARLLASPAEDQAAGLASSPTYKMSYREYYLDPATGQSVTAAHAYREELQSGRWIDTVITSSVNAESVQGLTSVPMAIALGTVRRFDGDTTVTHEYAPEILEVSGVAPTESFEYAPGAKPVPNVFLTATLASPTADDDVVQPSDEMRALAEDWTRRHPELRAAPLAYEVTMPCQRQVSPEQRSVDCVESHLVEGVHTSLLDHALFLRVSNSEGVTLEEYEVTSLDFLGD